MPQPIKWTQIKQSGTKQPGGRYGHTITTVGKNNILFGGLEGKLGKGQKAGPTNDVFKIKLQGEKCEWTLVQCQGDIPQPRTNHAACAISEDKLLIFGGYYTSNYRFNDTYILKIGATYTWSQPPNQKSSGSPKNAESKIGAPEPRADHTATYLNGKVYIFGGHGGVGYSRQSFNDLYSLNTETFEWELIQPEGTPPDARGGHVASVLANQNAILIYGGWSFTSQFSNLMIYDVDKNTWIDSEISHEQPKWNLTAVLAPSIPSWKYFIFGGSVGSFEEGGNRTVSRYVNDSFYFDIDFSEWKNIMYQNDDGQEDPNPEKPKAREQQAMFYDKDNARIIIHGGWSSNWLNDMWSLSVGSITGPPYAIFGLKPKLGPLTGKTQIQIEGEGFKNSQNIVVKFSSGKASIEVPATYLSEKLLEAETPSFEQYGPRKATVVVSINKGDFTITESNFQYYLNTDGKKCIAYGPGLMHSNAVKEPTVFIIQAINTAGQSRESGSDKFRVKIQRPDKLKAMRDAEEAARIAEENALENQPESRANLGSQQSVRPQSNATEQRAIQEEKKEGEKEEEQENQQENQQEEQEPLDPSLVPFEQIDNDDGTYLIRYSQPEDCEVEITVEFLNEFNEHIPIRGSPFTAAFSSENDPKNNQLFGIGPQQYIKQQLHRVKEFIEQADEDINYKKKDLDQVSEIITIMSMLNKIDEIQDQEILNLDTIEEMIKAMKKEEDRKELDQWLKETRNQQAALKKLILTHKAVDKDIKSHKENHEQRTKTNIQNLETSMKEYQQSLKQKDFFTYATGVEKSQQTVEEVNLKIAEFQQQIDQFQEQVTVFNFPDVLEGCNKLLEGLKIDTHIVDQLWQRIAMCQERFAEYLQLKWGEINMGDMEDNIKALRKSLNEIKGLNQYRYTNTYQGITEDLKKWSNFLPSLGELKDPAMNSEDERHWKRLKELVGKEFTVDESLQLQTVWDLELYLYKDGIEEITDQAKQEQKMEKNINTIINYWKDIEFELVSHKGTDTHTLKLNEENFEQLEEHQLQINNMLLSKYVGFYEPIVEKWKQDLGAVYDVVFLVKEVQNTWSFLENLFIQSEEVKKELPNESKQFIGIDKNMREIMKDGCDIKNVAKFCTQDDLLNRLEQIEKELKVCEKALNDFLDSKRRAFPRFYFVSVNDLLDILSNGNQPTKINKHMAKIFQAISRFTMEEGGDRPTVTEMKSCVGIEQVKLQPLKLVGKVEIYLQDVIDNIQKTLNDITSQSYKAQAQMERKQWISQDPAQITLLVNNIIWSAEVEQNFLKLQQGEMNALKDFKDKSISLLTDLIKMVQGDLDKPLRQKIMCLITLDAHSRDVVIRLIDEHVRKAEEFQWQSQLKFFWENNNARINICDAVFWYNYEYLGNGPRLVVTPLTDRIYVTATQALHLNLGCAPAGPAGTGKTETTKDLANALAKACYVFNCGPEMDYQTMGNIYKGLASSGCWGCFDEFNRLLPEVLSVCSVQFKAVTDAVKAKAKRFIIEGDEITLDPTCGAFITMNPGYLGRAELPEGLKALFRPITVVVPDLELICENMLMAEGFVSAKILAKKFTTLYLLCKDLLSKQKHYDWGMRAIKSVLVVAGGFKRAEQNIAEDALLMRALRDFNIPKIVFADVPIFFGLLGDLFPGIDIPRQRDMRFEKIIEQSCKDSGLYPDEEFVLKVVQLGELLAIRHCVFIMGSAGAGKSSCWQTLGKAYDKDQKKCTIIDLDPKVVSTKDFYGYIQQPSKEWKDGLFSQKLRTMSEMPEDENPKWIILDGDLDANWIESMNSVMDDNKILTLANNERIPVKGLMRLIFEIRDLRFATPATCSRAGILYIPDESGYQYKAYFQSWLTRKVKKEDQEQLRSLFDRYIDNTLDYLKKNVKYLIPMVNISQIISMCKALEPLLEQGASNLEYIFNVAAVWGIGGALAEKDGIDYKKEFSNWWKGGGPSKTQVKFPSKGSVFDYYIDTSDGQCRFAEWSNKLHSIDFDPNQGQQMNNVTVPTVQTVATSDFIQKFIYIKHPSLIIGNAGCGKTQLAKGILKDITTAKGDQYSYQMINFNYFTDAVALQGNLEQQLEKKAGRQFGPQGKGVKIFFVDDLNMPQRDPYDTQSAIALLRQLADYSHWYDIAKLTLKDIINTQVIASMNPSAGSFFVNPRYQRHFWTISIPFPDNESLYIIYNTFLNGHLKRFKSSIQEQSNLIVRATLLIHQAVSASFKKTAINFHYEFNLRHISNIFQGMLLSDPTRFQEPDKIIKLWIHEVERTYGDRLVSPEHLKIMRESLADITKKSFGKFNLNKYIQKDNAEPLIFCNFNQGIGGERLYDQMPNTDNKLHFYVSEALKEYNDINAYMGLVLFEDALRHITRICRIVLPPSGHALLVGVGGSGKQSLSKLSAFIMGYTLFQITISATYGIADLKTDLQTLFLKSGFKEEGILFLFTEGQITNEKFLVYINDLLSSGEISDLYNSDEKEAMINNCRGKVKSLGKPDTKENCWNWFIDSVKKNLHMSICFSPVGDMRRRAKQFPALINSTVIDWFQPWPYEALYGVSEQFLAELDLGEDPVVRQGVVKFMPYSFNMVNQLGIKLLEQERRYAYTTPKSFLELIKLFTNMLNKRRTEQNENIEKYENGLVKLKETEEQVAIINEEVQAKQIEAEAIRKEADAFAQVVGVEKEKVDKENAKAQIEQDKCATIKKDVTEKKTSTQADLDAAQPLVQEATAALDNITKKDYQTAKSYATPPSGVDMVFASVVWLLAGFFPEAIEIDRNKKPKNYDWKACLKLMKNPDQFVNLLKGFKDTVDQNLVPPGNVEFIKKNYLSHPDFNPQVMAAKSGAAKGVCEWVLNIVKYYDVIQQIEPKRKALKEATEQLEDATKKLNIVEEIVRDLNEKLATLTSKYDEANAQKMAAEAEAARCSRRLNLAQRLVSALGSEKIRWAASIESLKGESQLIVGNVLLAAAFVSYAGPFNKKFRTEMIEQSFMKFIQENSIPGSIGMDPVKIMTSDALAAEWNQQNLPSDNVSIENGTILSNSERYPLMIDPQLQGIQWIKEKEKNNNLKVLRLGQKNTNRDLEVCIEQGYSCLFENIPEQIDPILMPVVARQCIKKGRKIIQKFAGKDLELHPNFRLFMQTKLSNPHYPPEVQAEAAIINFMVTEDGLCDQLLTQVVGRERPDLAKKKVELIKQQNDFKIKLGQLEKDLLYKLANAKGDILDDIELIENLEYSKKLSVEIGEKVEIAKVTEAKINETSENYRPAAARGALFYFLLSDLPKIHSFYKYSLESFITVINRAIDKISEKKMFSSDGMIPFTGKEDEIEDEENNEGEEDEGEEEEEQEAQEEEQQQENEQQQEKDKDQEENKDEQEKQEGDEKQEGEEKQEDENAEDAENKEEEVEDDQKDDEQIQENAEEEEDEKEGENQAQMEEEPLSPRSLNKRVDSLINSLTYTAFQNTRRGLFEKHKLIVAAILTLRILLRSGELNQEEVTHLIIGKQDPNPGQIPDVLKSVITDSVWSSCKALSNGIPYFKDLCSNMETDYLQWKKWYQEEKAEMADIPKQFKDIDRFNKLLLLRALRPDRVTSALGQFVQDKMGEEYIEQPAFNMDEIFFESQPTVPLFFVLFPGVDPTPDVEKVAQRFDISSKNKRFINISMGQGQEEGAKKAIFDCARKGYWVMLQNLHLMQSWLYGMQGLEGFLESVFANPKTHPNFRVFLSSEPPPLPDMQIIPESILQGSLKIANEAPSNLKANLRRAYALFDQPFLDSCDKKPGEFKACLFALCMFHSLIIGRKKFGSQGWSRIYNFNDGDLRICADVLKNYLQNYDVTPWSDLRYLFGEIMYGGHITDNWDRRTNRIYLEILIKPELLQPNFNLCQGYKSPTADKFNYEKYRAYIEENLPIETPQMFGMHPNAEIGYLTAHCDTVFETILEVSGGGSGGAKNSGEDQSKIILADLQKRSPPQYQMILLEEKAKEKSPFQVVCLQECERMNLLLQTIKVSLEDLRLGLEGALNMTDQMEILQQCLTYNRVPSNWEEVAYPSKKPLLAWFNDMLERCKQLDAWTDQMVTPNSLCISYLFNPMSFLTAISQDTARKKGYALDNIALQTNVTSIKTHEEITGPAPEGKYIHGLYLEGAGWEIGGEGQEGYLVDQKPKELHPKMPVINVISVPREEKRVENQYECPMYVTSARGATFVYTANLTMEDESPNKWILSGTCILMSDD